MLLFSANQFNVIVEFLLWVVTSLFRIVSRTSMSKLISGVALCLKNILTVSGNTWCVIMVTFLEEEHCSYSTTCC